MTVLHESYQIWSPGLRKDQYQEYMWRQMNHTWARRNYKFFVLKHKSQVVCSCKLYTVNLASKGKQYIFGGIGAIYTMNLFRNQGFATKLIAEVIEYCYNNDYAGTILFSDIDPEFYNRLGFAELGAADFGVHMPKGDMRSEYCAPNVTYVERHHIPIMISIYNKWQRRQPYGFQRSELYLHYKLGRERFLADYSTLSWPKLEITFALENAIQTGYALTERGGHNLRILELVGPESARRQLWCALVEHAITHRMHKVRGWESVAADLFPGFRMEEVLPQEMTKTCAFAPLTYTQRHWGRPMYMPFDEKLEDWMEHFPCPFLELDHL